jgi:hypothetical protein
MAQADTADRRVRITKDVPVLRIDHISIKGMLLGMWQVSDSGKCDLGSREVERVCPHSQRGFDRQKSEARKIKKEFSDASRGKSSWLVVGLSQRKASIRWA